MTALLQRLAIFGLIKINAQNGKIKKWDQFRNFQKTFRNEQKKIICSKFERVVSSNDHIDFKLEIKIFV